MGKKHKRPGAGPRGTGAAGGTAGAGGGRAAAAAAVARQRQDEELENMVAIVGSDDCQPGADPAGQPMLTVRSDGEKEGRGWPVPPGARRRGSGSLSLVSGALKSLF